MKKVYFACSIRGGRDDVQTYESIVGYLNPKCILLTEVFADKKLTSEGMNKPSEEIWKVDLEWLKDADLVVAEVTNPSLGVGYEIAKAEAMDKPILALFRNDGTRRLSAMIEGSPNIHVVYYETVEEVEQSIEAFLKEPR